MRIFFRPAACAVVIVYSSKSHHHCILLINMAPYTLKCSQECNLFQSKSQVTLLQAAILRNDHSFT